MTQLSVVIYAVKGFSVVKDVVTGSTDSTDAVVEKLVRTDAVTELSVGKYQLQRQLHIQMHIYFQRLLLGIR